MKIGFFDSGLGGLIILKAVAQALPEYDYEFYGDTAHVPYGDKSEAEIFALTKVGVEHLFNRDCQLIIIACNTASAETLRRLQDTILVGRYRDRRILGVIIPTVETVSESGVKDVMLFATTRTVESRKYELEFSKLSNTVALSTKALPTLVPLLEGGKFAEAEDICNSEVRLALEARAGAVILGCTHYSLLKGSARRAAGEAGQVFSQDEIIPHKLANYLNRHPEIVAKLSRHGTRNIYLTDNTTKYDSFIRQLMGGFIIEK